MTKRLLIGYLTVTLVVLLLLEVPLAVFYAQRERERLTAGVDRDASVIATIYEDALEQGRPLDPQPANTYRNRTGARVVIVDDQGISRVDTDQPTPRDFSTRPEFAIALSGERSAGTRLSETLGTDLLYVAIPVASGGDVHGAIRLTLGTSRIDTLIHRFWAGLVAIAAIVLAVMALIGWAVARSVTRPVRRLNEAAKRFAEGDLSVAGHEPPAGPPELRTLAETMSTMAVRLAAILDEQRAFVADASHQLRTPLTALRLRLENLQSRVAAADAAELDAAIDETSRLATLVTDLLQLASADRLQVTAAADLARLTADRVDTWSAVAEIRGVELRLVGLDGPLFVRAVPGAIEQILDNVLDNALAVSTPGSDVTITLDHGTIDRGIDNHRLTISDHGPGLSDEDKQRAIRRFWRGNASTPGSGLGLAIADTLAGASGGSLQLTDTAGRGLTVVVTFRAADRPTSARQPIETAHR